MITNYKKYLTFLENDLYIFILNHKYIKVKFYKYNSFLINIRTYLVDSSINPLKIQNLNRQIFILENVLKIWRCLYEKNSVYKRNMYNGAIDNWFCNSYPRNLWDK